MVFGNRAFGEKLGLNDRISAHALIERHIRDSFLCVTAEREVIQHTADIKPLQFKKISFRMIPILLSP
jgi:hypothetical protein